jgi:hypothetical protein
LAFDFSNQNDCDEIQIKKLEDNYPKVFLVIGALLILAIFN